MLTKSLQLEIPNAIESQGHFKLWRSGRRPSIACFVATLHYRVVDFESLSVPDRKGVGLNATVVMRELRSAAYDRTESFCNLR
jgi:hypothetical protein